MLSSLIFTCPEMVGIEMLGCRLEEIPICYIIPITLEFSSFSVGQSFG